MSVMCQPSVPMLEMYKNPLRVLSMIQAWGAAFGLPALCAARTKPVVLAVAGDDRERETMSGIF